jgi:hypothetical protein
MKYLSLPPLREKIENAKFPPQKKPRGINELFN